MIDIVSSLEEVVVRRFAHLPRGGDSGATGPPAAPGGLIAGGAFA